MEKLKTPQHKIGEYNVCRAGSEFKFYDGWRVRVEVENAEHTLLHAMRELKAPIVMDPDGKVLYCFRARVLSLNLYHLLGADDVVSLPDDTLKTLATRSLQQGTAHYMTSPKMHLSILTAHTNAGVIRRIYGIWDEDAPWVVQVPEELAMLMECQFVSAEGWLPL